MNDESRQPTEYDLVLGGNNPPPVDGLVLGGIAEIKRRLESNNIEIIKSALSDAIAYQEKGLDLVINALYNTPQEIRQHAVSILRYHKTPKAEQALLDYDPNSLFVRFSDWNLKDFNLESYLDEPVNTAYRIDLDKFSSIISELKKIEPQGSKIEALYLPMWSDWAWDCDRGKSVSYKECIDLLLDAHQQLPNLKALFLADDTSDSYAWGSRSDYKRYKICMEEVCYLLEAYPNLELLHLQGRDGLELSKIKHNNLKSLVIESRDLCDRALEEVFSLNLPKLEYLELWLGADYEYRRKRYHGGNNISLLANLFRSLLSKQLFTNLKYLGLCSCEWANDLVYLLKDNSIINKLRILNLSKGTLTDEGAEILLNCPAVNKLHTLDVSMNLLSTEMIHKLSQLDCNVIAEPQDVPERGEESCGYERYSALYE